MSSNKKSKSEFVGMLRSFFGSGSNSNTDQNNSTINEPPKEKKSIKKKMRSRLSFMGVGSVKKFGDTLFHQKRSSERRGAFGFMRKSAACDFDQIDLSLNVSNILKGPNSTRSKSCKITRFEDNIQNELSVVQDFSNVLQEEENFYSLNSVQSVFMDPNESDQDYYKRMKEEILSRNKRPPIAKPKRKKFKPSENTTQLAECVDSPVTRQFPHDDDTVLSAKHNIIKDCVTSTPNTLSKSDALQANKDLNKSSNIEDISKNLNDIDDFDWKSQDEDNFGAIPGNSKDPPNDTIVTQLGSDQFWNFFANAENSQTLANEFCGKVASSKKSKSNRFDPIARNVSCGVAMLKDSTSDSNRMSWCSVSSF